MKKIILIYIIVLQVLSSLDIYEHKDLSLSCEKGDVNVCYKFAMIYYRGIPNGIYDKGYYTVIVEPLRKSCDSGNAPACWYLGKLYERGNSVMKNSIKSRDLYQKSCDMSGHYCAWIANMYEHGFFVQKNYSKALKYYQIGCKRGDTEKERILCCESKKKLEENVK